MLKNNDDFLEKFCQPTVACFFVHLSVFMIVVVGWGGGGYD